MEDKSQNNWCVYSALPQPSIFVRRFDSKSNRFYYWQVPQEGKFVTQIGIGITSLLSLCLPESKALTDWKVSQDDYKESMEASASYGTIMHNLVQTWLIEGVVPQELIDEAKAICEANGVSPHTPEKDLLAWILFCEEHEVEPMLMEALLVSPPIDGNNHYCQAIDLLCKLSVKQTRIELVEDGEYKSGPRKGEKKIVENKIVEKVRKVACLDWKSNFKGAETKSFYDSHKYQLIAAKRAVEHNYPDVKVDMLLNWSPLGWRTKPNYTLKQWNITERDEALFDNYIRTGLLSGFFWPSGHIFVPPIFTKETKSSDYSLLSYTEYVEQVLLAEPVNNMENECNNNALGNP